MKVIRKKYTGKKILTIDDVNAIIADVSQNAHDNLRAATTLALWVGGHSSSENYENMLPNVFEDQIDYIIEDSSSDAVEECGGLYGYYVKGIPEMIEEMKRLEAEEIKKERIERIRARGLHILN